MSKKTTQEESVKKGSTEKVDNKVIAPAKMPKAIANKLEKTKAYNHKEAGSYDALLQSARDADLENLSYNKKIKHYLGKALIRLEQIGTKKTILDKLTFQACNRWKNESEKFEGLTGHVSTFQARQIVHGYLKSIDGNIARGERVAKQGGTTGKKADKQARRGANTK